MSGRTEYENQFIDILECLNNSGGVMPRKNLITQQLKYHEKKVFGETLSNVRPLYDTENKQLMVFEEFNIHPEKESDRKLVDWDRTYFLTKYYC